MMVTTALRLVFFLDEQNDDDNGSEWILIEIVAIILEKKKNVRNRSRNTVISPIDSAKVSADHKHRLIFFFPLHFHPLPTRFLLHLLL